MKTHLRLAALTSCSADLASQRSLRAAIEQLESRDLLAGDLFVSLYDPMEGMSVLHYDSSNNLVGGVETGEGGLVKAQSLAVAPDGTIFVSSMDTGNVLHFTADGDYIDTLGAGDAVKPFILVPGTLQFGPNGNLYVADILTGGIHQFDIDNVGQQYVIGSSLNPGFGTGGYTWDADGNIIVGSLVQKSVTRFDSQGNATPLIEPDSGIVPAAILVRPDGDLLIADIDFGGEPLLHHQILLYDMSEDTTSVFIDLTFPVGTGDAEGNPPQPLSMIYDEDGELLIGVSPDHNFNGAVQRFNSETGEYIETVVSGIGTPSGLVRVQGDDPAGIVGRYIFYNQSTFNFAGDDAAIAPDKSPYFVDQGVAGEHTVTSYDRGINGIMVDVANAGGTLTAADFTFKIGKSNSPSSWALAPAPSAIAVRPGEGVNGSDRVTITWSDGAIKNTWLEVTVEGNDEIGGFNTNTGLVSSDVFYFGNRVGDSFASTPGVSFVTNATDEIGARTNTGFGVAITNIFDFNRDMVVNATDQIIARTNTGFMTRLNLVTNPPQAQPQIAGDAKSAVAAALAVSSTRFETTLAPVSELPKAAEAIPVVRHQAIAAVLAVSSIEVADTDEPSDLADELIEVLSLPL